MIIHRLKSQNHIGRNTMKYECTEARSKLRGSRGNEAQTQENLEPPYVGCHGFDTGSKAVPFIGKLKSGLFSRIHAVGQASRLSLALKDRLGALFFRPRLSSPKGEENFLDGDRRDACPTQAGARIMRLATAWIRFSVQDAGEVSKQLQAVIVEHAGQGREFVTLNDVNIEVKPGCLAGLFGAKTAFLPFDQIVFRKAIGS
jgi:hypothetical protein